MQTATAPSPPKAYRPLDIARALGWPKSSVYRAIQSGDLPSVRLSDATICVLADDLNEFIAKRRTTSRTE